MLWCACWMHFKISCKKWNINTGFTVHELDSKSFILSSSTAKCKHLKYVPKDGKSFLTFQTWHISFYVHIDANIRSFTRKEINICCIINPSRHGTIQSDFLLYHRKQNPKAHETDDTIKTATSFFNLSASDPNNQTVKVMWQRSK